MGAQSSDSGECAIGSYVTQSQKPLRFTTEAGQQLDHGLRNLNTAFAMASCGIGANLTLLANLPVHWISGAPMASTQESKTTKAALGDTHLLLRWTLLNRDIPYQGGSFALAPYIVVPRNRASQIAGMSLNTLSEGQTAAGGQIIYDYFFTARHYVAANLGYHHRQTQTFLGTKVGPESRMALGYSYLLDAVSGFHSYFEWQRRQSLGPDKGNQLLSSSEWQVGLGAKPFGDHLAIFTGAGKGLGGGFGTPVQRLFAGIEWTISKPAPPLKAFEETELDLVVLNAQKESGSVQLQLRASKRKDIAFTLRTSAGGTVLSGKVKSSGPTLNSIPPGVYTIEVQARGYMKKSQTLVITPGITSVIEVTPQKAGDLLLVSRLAVPGIQFETKKAIIKPESFTDLDRLAKVMRDSQAIQLLAIEGHTDNVGQRERNVNLSAARANAVENYLIDKGVDPRRLTTKGIGPDSPAVANDSAAGRAKNRRVEFVIRAVATAH
jgi:outer membrane protein OmpA-like peptidoglycan-associated protein